MEHHHIHVHVNKIQERCRGCGRLLVAPREIRNQGGHTNTQFAADVHSVFGRCTLSIWQMYTQYLADVHSVFGRCTLSIWQMYTQYLADVHSVFGRCTLSIWQMYTHNDAVRLKFFYRCKQVMDRSTMPTLSTIPYE